MSYLTYPSLPPVSAGEVGGGTAGRRAETLNNNPNRAQPTAQRQPLNYNNNLGSSSTLGPAQTHIHTPPPATPAVPAAETAKKIDVNVGKQKNCSGKTSNETKKVGKSSVFTYLFVMQTSRIFLPNFYLIEVALIFVNRSIYQEHLTNILSLF